MFIRKKKNQSGSISIQIISKRGGKYRVVESIGCSKDKKEIEILFQKAKERLKELEPSLLDYLEYNSSQRKLSNKDIRVIGDELIFGKIFDDLGCAKIAFENKKKRDIFRHLILSRLLYPGSKLYLIDYYHIYKKQKIEKNQIYRTLDAIYQEALKKEIEYCVFSHTKKVMDNNIAVTFYDVTTLYFESESEDDLKKVGFSKEGKLARPQIQLGLFTTLEGYPLAYDIFQGNKYEGHTLIEVLEHFQQRFKLKQKPIVVADRGMLTKENIAYLQKNGYRYIIAARIKNLSHTIKQQIINLPFINDGIIHTIELEEEIKEHKQRLILTFSSQRAKKDSYNREKALKKLQIKLTNNPNLTKNDLKRSAYAKFLKLKNTNCKVSFTLDEKMIEDDKKFDGIKGFITNDFSLSPNQIVAHYQNIYTIEKAFRISKTDLKVRPIYHRLEHRIKAHILIAFASYAIYKEFERRIKQSNLDIKFKLTFDYIKTMYGYKTPFGVEPLKLDDIQQKIYDAVHLT